MDGYSVHFFFVVPSKVIVVTLHSSSLLFACFTNLGHFGGGLICLGYLCLNKDAYFLLEFHMEALDWSGCDISRICNSL